MPFISIPGKEDWDKAAPQGRQRVIAVDDIKEVRSNLPDNEWPSIIVFKGGTGYASVKCGLDVAAVADKIGVAEGKPIVL